MTTQHISNLQQPQPHSLLGMPDPILLKIFEYLDPTTQAYLRTTCSSLNKIGDHVCLLLENVKRVLLKQSPIILSSIDIPPEFQGVRRIEWLQDHILQTSYITNCFVLDVKKLDALQKQ